MESGQVPIQMTMDHPRVYVLSRKLIAINYAFGVSLKCAMCGEPIMEGSWYYSRKGWGKGTTKLYHVTCAMVRNLL